MANYFERTWQIRDAVLSALAIKTANREVVTALTLETVASTIPWGLDPLTGDEVAEAVEWLLNEEFVTGEPTMQGVVIRPEITAKGERLVTVGRSVRDSPSDRHTVVSPFTLSTNGGVTTVAVNSPGARQTVTVTHSFQKFEEFAQAVERAVADAAPDVHQQAIELAAAS